MRNASAARVTILTGPSLSQEDRTCVQRSCGWQPNTIGALGEELLDKLKDARTGEANDATSPTAPTGSLDTPAAVRQRLRLAEQLLDADVERALQFADPALGTVTMEGVDFLSSLRDKNPAAAITALRSPAWTCINRCEVRR